MKRFIKIVLVIAMVFTLSFITTVLAASDSFVYIDDESGVSFTVPENWEQKEFFEDREYIDAKFVSTKEAGTTIVFGNTDVWEQIPDYYKIGYTRADIRNDFYTKSDVAEMTRTTEDNISIVSYNGVEYFEAKITGATDVYGVDISFDAIELLYMDNGWMYTFYFGGTDFNQSYSDFEKLLNSVQYPAALNTESVYSSDDNNTVYDNTNNNSGYNSGAVAVVILLLIAAVSVIVILTTRIKKSQITVEADNIMNNEILTPETQNNTETTIVCKNCGQALPSDSAFCHKCGTKINKGDN